MLTAQSLHACGAVSQPPFTETELTALNPQQRADYQRNGYLRVDSIASEADIAWVREIYDGLFMEKRGWETGDFFETAGDFEGSAPVLPQMNWLSRHEPGLRDSSLHRNALAIARALIGPRAELVWEFAMMKPALVGGATPAHQDQAFFTKETDYNTAISIWIPLQDVDMRNGCMQYAPGSHLGSLHAHQSIGGDPRAHGLEAILAQDPVFEAVPLRAGAAVLHHSRTLHCAGPNQSENPRRAYILEFAVRSRAELLFEDYAWNRAKRTARDERQRRSTPATHRAMARLRWLKKRFERSLISSGFRFHSRAGTTAP